MVSLLFIHSFDRWQNIHGHVTIFTTVTYVVTVVKSLRQFDIFIRIWVKSGCLAATTYGYCFNFDLVCERKYGYIYVTIQDYFGLLEHKITKCSQNVRLCMRGLYSFVRECNAKTWGFVKRNGSRRSFANVWVFTSISLPTAFLSNARRFGIYQQE